MDDLKNKLDPRIFWDVDFAAMDINQRAAFVTLRVLERGTLAHWRLVRAYYGDEKIKQVVTNTKWLDKKIHSFCSAIFNIPKEQFVCFTTRLLNPTHGDY